MMRYLAVDLGDRRTGLAVGDSVTGLVSPAGTIEVARGPALLEAIVGALTDHAPDVVVIGLPLNMDDTEGPRARIVREFAAELERRTAMPIRFQDERLTSFAADQAMSQTGRTHREKKQLRDALAAVEILQDYMAGRAESRRSED